MQIKTLTTGPNAGTTYYVDNNGKFAGLATHSNPNVDVKAYNESKGYTTPEVPVAPAEPTQLQAQTMNLAPTTFSTPTPLPTPPDEPTIPPMQTMNLAPATSSTPTPLPTPPEPVDDTPSSIVSLNTISATEPQPADPTRLEPPVAPPPPPPPSTSAITPTPVTQISDAQVAAGNIATDTGQIAGPLPTAGTASTVSDASKVTAPEEGVTASTYTAKTAKQDSDEALETVKAETIDTTEGLPTGATVTAQTLAQQQPPVTTQPATAGATTTTAQPTATDVGQIVEQKAGADSGLRQIGLDAAQIDPTKVQAVDAPDALTAVQTTKDVQGDLLNTNVSSVDQTVVENAISKTAAATATPSEQATVQGQLATLTANFDATNPPAWAAGALRAANAQMSARGLSASSMAGQAILQATFESALPIAQIDASTFAQFEAQNLSNRQQVAMFGAQQRAKFLEIEFNQDFQMRVANASRIADIANINFSADQQIALENSRMAQSVDLANLSNKQAKVMADAAALTNLDMTELNNRQQAAIQNAQNFLAIEMANLSNEQQTSLFKAQATQQTILSDTAAENAEEQFNASSKNQVDMFMANLAVDISKANADIAMFNAGEENKFDIFNAELAERREQFNAQNGLIIAQANAAWRQATTTANNATQNEANRIDAAASTGMTRAQMDEYWQSERDKIAYAFGALESEKDRLANIYIAEMSADKAQQFEDNKAKGNIFSTIALAFLKTKLPSWNW